MPQRYTNIKTTNNRPINESNLAYIDSVLRSEGVSSSQRYSIESSIIEESGADPTAVSADGKFQGLLQWGADRYRIQSKDSRKELENQVRYLLNTLNDTTDRKSWTDGGKGSGFKSKKDAYAAFNNQGSPLEDVLRGFSFGYALIPQHIILLKG